MVTWKEENDLEGYMNFEINCEDARRVGGALIVFIFFFLLLLFL
jgi:hypothetical protein